MASRYVDPKVQEGSGLVPGAFNEPLARLSCKIKELSMQCKECNKTVLLSISGLGQFCSWDCRKSWKSKKNKAFYASQSGEKTIQPSSSQNSVTITNGKQTENSTPFQQSESLSKLIDELGGKKWYDLAKRLCCNFDVRAREGYCVYLFDSKRSHKKQCRFCELGQGLMRYDSNRRLVRRAK
jgi:hypothetical protein